VFEKRVRGFGLARREARSYTLVLIGNYTRYIRGRVRNIGLTRRKVAILVFRPDKNWLQILVRMLHNMLKSRFNGLVRALKRAGMDKDDAFGVVREYITWFELVIMEWESRFKDLL